MAPHFLTKILSIFSLGRKKNKRNSHFFNEEPLPASYPADVKDPLSSSHVNRQSALLDCPPAYTSLSSNHTTRPTSPDLTVQICPHENLTHARLTRIVNLPAFKTNGSKLDALTPASDFHHRGHDKDTKDCQDSCKPLPDVASSGVIATMKGFGTYTYRTACSSSSSNAEGLLCSFHWEMKTLDPKLVTYSTTTELAAFLKTANVQLCPHKCLHDTEVVNAIHPIVNPNGVPADPIERYLAKQGKMDCEKCGTKIKVYLRTEGVAGRTCRVDTKRLLGKGESWEEWEWVRQCGGVM